MAWQLIYTSAPRLLEAGRSGFGTVARHRQINPLLTAAVERFSQFSRLPGLDPARVIFAYRTVTAGSGPFHVLSFVRDSGADYTGRTNHLAHHLILDPREVAALSRTGPSPADVLLAMPWRQQWDEPPRWLDASDEIAVAKILPQTTAAGTAWAQTTGEANHVWLLAQGEANRGACLLTPRGLDLRPLFAESLRATPDRVWQTTFTTSFQPSDDAGDFRWLGVEAGSDLAATITSGRPVLDLSAPHSLPLVELISPASVEPAVAPATAGSQSYSFATSATEPASSGAESGRFARRKEAAAGSAPDDPFDFQPTRRGSKTPFLIAAAVLVVAILGAGIWWQMDRLGKESARRRQIIAGFQNAEYFNNDESRRELDQWLKDVRGDQLARLPELARTAVALAAPLAKSSATIPIKPDATIRLGDAARKAGAPDFPPSIKALRDGLDQIAEWQRTFSNIEATPGSYEALTQELQRLKQASGPLQTAPFAALRNRLEALAESKRLDALQALIASSEEPKGGATRFRTALADISEAGLNAAARERHAKLKQVLNDWTSIEHDAPAAVKMRFDSPSSADWQPWLKRLARSKLPKDSAPPLELTKPTAIEAVSEKKAARLPAVHYFAKDAESMAALVVNELADELKFEWSNPAGERTPLAFKKSGKVRRDFKSQNDGFIVQKQKVAREPQGPQPPFVFTARDPASKTEVFSIYVGWPTTGTPLLGRNDAPPKLLSADTLSAPINLPALGDDGAALLLRTPADFDGEKQFMLPAKTGGGFDAAPAVAAAKRRRDAHIKTADEFSRGATELEKGAGSIENLQKRSNEFASTLKRDAAKKVRDPKAEIGAQIVGEFAMALAIEWMEVEEEHEKTQKGKQKDQKPRPPSQFESLRGSGRSLADALKDSKKAKDATKQLLGLTEDLQKRFRDNEHAPGLGNIRSLCVSLSATLGDAAGLKEQVNGLRRQAENEEAAAARIQALPLLSGKIPPGEYALICRARDGSEVSLYTFDASKP